MKGGRSVFGYQVIPSTNDDDDDDNDGSSRKNDDDDGGGNQYDHIFNCYGIRNAQKDNLMAHKLNINQTYNVLIWKRDDPGVGISEV